MKQQATDSLIVEEEEHFPVQQDTFSKQLAPASNRSVSSCKTMSLSQLAALCLAEIENYYRGEPYTDIFGVELLRRATVYGDSEAWAWMQQCFSAFVLGWLRRHPYWEIACRIESEENYVAQAFERFWQATTLTRSIAFTTLAAALRYLRLSLNGVILDSLRANARSREVPLPEPGEPGEPGIEDDTFGSEVWEVIRAMLPDKREKRLAYLLFYCGLKAREIVRYLPDEWHDVHEIYHLSRTITERLRRNADQLRWHLS